MSLGRAAVSCWCRLYREWRLAGRGVSVWDIVVLGCEWRTSLSCGGAWASLGFCLVVVGLSEKAEKLSSANLLSSEILISSESRYFWACGDFMGVFDFTGVFDWVKN